LAKILLLAVQVICIIDIITENPVVSIYFEGKEMNAKSDRRF